MAKLIDLIGLQRFLENVKQWVNSTKQDILVSGSNIKTINDQSLLGEGNIDIQGGGSSDAVLYTEQSLTSEQQSQARTNIGAGTSSFSGSYNDLSNKPTNVSAFTNDAGYLTKHQDISGKEDVSNKIDEWVDNLNKGQYPSAALVKASLDRKYQKPAGGIPASDLERGVIPTVPTISTDISSDATSDTKTVSPKAVKTFVEGKGYGTYSKPSGGIPATDLASGVIPTVPTISTNVVTDKASDTKTSSPKSVYDEIHPAVATTQPSGGFLPNIVYRLGTITGSVTFALATPADSSIANYYYWSFDAGSTAPTITWPTGIDWMGGSAPTINASKHYEISVIGGVASCLSDDNQGGGGGGGTSGVTDVTVGGTSVVTDGVAAVPAIPTVPTISTDVVADKASTTKTACPKAVYDEIHPANGSSQPSGGMLPNVLYNLGTLTGTVTFSMASAADSSIANHWYWTFDTSSTAPTITWPAAITSWFGGSAPTINASKHYEISVLGGIGVAMEV